MEKPRPTIIEEYINTAPKEARETINFLQSKYR
jgi:hypothetical protein